MSERANNGVIFSFIRLQSVVFLSLLVNLGLVVIKKHRAQSIKLVRDDVDSIDLKHSSTLKEVLWKFQKCPKTRRGSCRAP